jgi:hypothetical protein
LLELFQNPANQAMCSGPADHCALAATRCIKVSTGEVCDQMFLESREWWVRIGSSSQIAPVVDQRLDQSAVADFDDVPVRVLLDLMLALHQTQNSIQGGCPMNFNSQLENASVFRLYCAAAMHESTDEGRLWGSLVEEA